MLHEARKVHEPKIDKLDSLLLAHFHDIFWAQVLVHYDLRHSWDDEMLRQRMRTPVVRPAGPECLSYSMASGF
jgi:hypothetical protein